MSSLSVASLGVIEKLEKHPDADTLDIATVDGMPAIVKTGDFQAGEQCIVIPFDCVIPKDTEQFDEMFRGKRIKPMRLRGIFSMCLVVKNKWGFKEGDDIMAALGIVKWEPGVEVVKNADEGPSPPGISIGKYDLDSLRKYHEKLILGEPVVITEKIHGANARYVYSSVDNRLYIGTRSTWFKPEADSQWHRIAVKYNLEETLRELPDVILFGEVYGQVQKGFNYGVPKGEYDFAAFDLLDTRNNTFFSYYDFVLATCDFQLPATPKLYYGEWQGFDTHKQLAEGESMLGGNIREGFVVKPQTERHDRHIGRVALKLHGEGYLLAQGKRKE